MPPFHAWKGDFRLRLTGASTLAPLQRESHGPSFQRRLSDWTPLRLRSLNYPGTTDSYALLLKAHDLIVPEVHEIGGLDVADADAVKAFVDRWDYEKLPIQEALRLFSYRGFPDRFDSRVLIRNLVFRAWLWIQRGIIPRINNVVRRGWYQIVKPVLARYRILLAPDYDRYFEELRYLTRVRELGITYKDFGFIDHERGTFWDLGRRHPEILLFGEKSELKGLFDRVNAEPGASYIVNHGQPSRFQVETLALEIHQAVADQEVQTAHMVSVVDFNPGGFAIEGAGVDGLSYHGLTVKLHRVLELRSLSEEQVEEFRKPLAEAIRRPDGTLEVTFGSVQNFSQCENWYRNLVQDPRFREEVAGPDGLRITYYGFDMDVLGEDWIEGRLKRILRKIQTESGAVDRMKRRRVDGGVGWAKWIEGYREAHGLRRARRVGPKAVQSAVALVEAAGRERGPAGGL